MGSDERGEIVCHPVFWEVARYWDFRAQPRRPYRLNGVPLRQGHPFIDVAERGIQRAIGLMRLRVQSGLARARRKGFALLNHGAADFGNARVFAGPHRRQQRGSVSRTLLRFETRYTFAENVGQDLPPEETARAAAGSSNRRHRHAETFNDVEAILLAVRNALDRRANKIRAGVARG